MTEASARSPENMIEFTDAHHFLERTRDFLYQNEVANNLLLSSALSLSRSHARTAFLTAIEEGRAVGAALRTPQERWIIAGSLPSAALLAEGVQRHSGRNVRSLWLPASHVSIFSETCGLASVSPLNFMTAKQLKPLKAASGLMRLALPKDLKTLVSWSQASAIETCLDESPREAAEIIPRYMDHRQLFVWENNGRVRAMAASGGFTPKSTRISQVYTDLRDRGQGYASALVHRLTHRLLSQSNHTCVLLTDAENPTTKAIYEKLGYETLASYAELRRAAQVFAGASVTTTG